MDDIEAAHYIVKKCLEETRAYKDHLRELKLLCGDLVTFAEPDIQLIFRLRLLELDNKFKNKEVTKCSDSLE